MIDLPQYLKEVCVKKESNTNDYELQAEANIIQPIFIRSNLVLKQKLSKGLSLFSLFWLTISQAVVKFIGINFKCKIQVTAKATFIAENCNFQPYDEKTECIVEIFANSVGIFKNCNFKNGNKASIAIRDRSMATFTNCNFENGSNTLLLALDKSQIVVDCCTFRSAERFSVYLYRNSISEIKNSQFLSQRGKSVFMLTGCQSRITNCQFEDCQSGGITIADSSEVFVDLSSFYNLGSSSIHGIKNSNISVKRSIFHRCKGNGVNFEYSTGYVYKCKFNNFDFPAIACFGPKATPVIFRCKIKNCKSMAVVSRDCAAPIFSRISVFNVNSHCFSISDFSEPLIEFCVLKKIKNSPFCIYNGSKTTIKNCLVKYSSIETDKNNLFKVFTNGEVIFTQNTLYSKSDRFNIKANYFGQIDLSQFVKNFLFMLNEGQNIDHHNGHLLYADEFCNVKVDEDSTEPDENQYFYDVEEEEEDKNERETVFKWDDEDQISLQNQTIDPKSNEIININYTQIDQILKNSQQTKHANTYPILVPQAPSRIEFAKPPSEMPKPLKPVDVNEVMQKISKLEAEEEKDKETETDNHNCHNECCGHFTNHKNDDDDHKEETEHSNCHSECCDHCHCIDNHEEDEDARSAGRLNLGVCLRCGKNKADQVIVPCGHKVLCKECASQEGGLCPLCDTPVQRCTEEFVEKKCVICLDKKCDTIILPCGHRCICYECASMLWTEKKQCPLCQTRVLTFRHMFKVYSDEVKSNIKHNVD